MSFPYKRILCAIDFDDNAMAAINEAGALARASEGVVVLMHAVWITPLAAEGYVLLELQKTQTEDASRKLEDLARRALAGAKHELEVVIGDPSGAILAAAKGRRTDLVVMATHGRRGLAHLVLGSIAEQVVRMSSVPVLTVRHTE
jgi:nucleotide-binding universal stress UspA family protein